MIYVFKFIELANEQDIIKWWNDHKANREEILRKIIALKLKRAGGGNPIFQAFSKVRNNQTASTSDNYRSMNESAPEIESVPSEPVHDDDKIVEILEIEKQVRNKPRTAPAQEKAMEQLASIEKELLSHLQDKNSGLSLSLEQKIRLDNLQKQKTVCSNKL